MIQQLIAKNLLQLVIAGVVTLAAGGGFIGLKAHYTNIGYQRAIEAIAAQDQEAINAADQARERVRACANSGSVWNVTEGVCAR